MTNRPDAIAILVSHQVVALVRCGRPLEQARQEAEAIVEGIVNDLSRLDGVLDVYLGVAIRRAKVYQLRCQGLTIQVISERMAICPAQAKNDYKAELARRRVAA